MTLRVYVFLAVLYEDIIFWKILEWEIWEAYSVVSWVCKVGIRAVSTAFPRLCHHLESWVHLS